MRTIYRVKIPCAIFFDLEDCEDPEREAAVVLDLINNSDEPERTLLRFQALGFAAEGAPEIVEIDTRP